MKKLLLILSKKERAQLFGLLLLGMAVAILEAIGVASIAPFVGMIADPDSIQKNEILFNLYKVFGLQNDEKFINYYGAIVIVLIAISISLKIINAKAYIKFTRLGEHEIGMRVAINYVKQDYVWFTSQNSAKLDSKILKEVHNMIYHVVEPGIILFGQAALVLIIVTMLIVLNPLVSMVAVIVLGGAYSAVFIAFKTFLKKSGERRLHANSERFVALRDLFGAIKEIKASGASSTFLKKFEMKSQEHSKVEHEVQLVAHLPRFVIELIAIGGLIIGILIATSVGTKFSDMAPTVTLFMFAAYKILPAMQQVHYSISHLRYAGPLVNQIYDEIQSLKNREEINPIRTSLNNEEIKSIELQEIAYKYPNANKQAIKNISMTIHAKTSVGIVGASGSGKTTLVDILLGLIQPDQGKIITNGSLVSNKNGAATDRRIGYVPQNVYILDDTVENNIVFGHNKEAINQLDVINAAKVANIDNLIESELPNGYKSVLGDRGVRISGGERQRIGIARAVYRSAQVLILDEATSSLDTINEKEILREIDKLKNKHTLIVIAHRLNTVKKCDVIYVLNNGELCAQGSYEELEKNNNYFRELLNIERLNRN